MNLLDLDTRWRRFNDASRACPCCGQTFSGIFDIAFDHPDDWPHAPRDDGETVVEGDDFLHSDLCGFGGRYFIRCVLDLTLRGSDETFSFGPWAEVSKDMAKAYQATFETPDAPFDGGEALLANTLPGTDAEAGDAVTLIPGPPEERPRLTAADGPLADVQSGGISFDNLLDIYAACGQDIRPHLTDD